MPIHEFRCTSCNFCFELLLMKKDEIDTVRCPKCQSPDVSKLVSAANWVGGGQASSNSSSAQPIQQRSCGSGSCTTINLPGHKK